MQSASSKTLVKINPELQEKVKPILTNLVTYLLKKKPQDPVPHIVQYFEELQGTATAPLSTEEAVELEQLRVKFEQLRAKQASGGSAQMAASAQKAVADVAKAKKAKDSDDGSSSDSEGEEDVGELPMVQPAAPGQQQNKRISVSAEVFGRYNKKEEYQAYVVPKSAEVKEKIKARLLSAFMFKALGQEELNIVVDAMEERKFDAGATVISQGEAGSVLFVVEEGELDCFKKLKPEDAEPTYLKTYAPGEAFGELALLYNAPRAATIIAKSASHLWQLDRNTFNHIVKDAAQNKRDKYEDFLASVPILATIDHYERSKIADTIKEMTYGAGQEIIKQGDAGDDFFLIISGEASAIKDGQQVMSYSPGDYFGERALLTREPRAATVQAKSDLKVATIDRDSFMRLLGPLDTILQRNMEKYVQFAGQ